MARGQSHYEFLQFLASKTGDGNQEAQLPSLSDLSQELHLSVASLREQLEVARALGLVDVRPRTGIRRRTYSFSPAVFQSLSYSMELNPAYFERFSDLRNHIEAAYFHEAVALLSAQDHQELDQLLAAAWRKLRAQHTQIPHEEHRQLHLLLFRRLNNPFVLGILEAFWDAYVTVGLNLYADFNYLQEVWGYHQRIVDAIQAGDYEAGYRALLEHKDLLLQRTLDNQTHRGGDQVLTADGNSE